MKTYQYQILRYVHDHFTGEFVNLGVVVYSPDNEFLGVLVCQRYSRITSMFPGANGKFIIKLVKNFEILVKKASRELTQLFRPSADLASITKTILPPDDSALILTNTRYGVDIDLEVALNDLYKDLVEKYLDSVSEQSLTDEDVWKKKYKSYFDRYRITEKLIPHEVVTKNDTFSFDKAWKNEIWHCYQPVSFDLQSKDAIRGKVYKWSGILREMNKIEEKIHITFLTTLSSHFDNLNEFIKESLDQDSDSIEVDVIADNQAEFIARKVSKAIEIHERDSE